jgi:hypothetical protein
MKRLLRAAARLYPRAWRVRYGREFDALVEDLTPRWWDVLNVIVGALVMQMSRPVVSPVVLAIVGAIAGALISLAMPPVYASSSQVAVWVPDTTADTDERAQRIRTAIEAVLHQAALDTKTIAVTLRGEPGSDPVLLQVSGSADSARAAQQVAEKATGSIIDANYRASVGLSDNRLVQFRVLERPNLPTTPQRGTMRTSSAGGALGLIVGAVFAFVGQRRRAVER